MPTVTRMAKANKNPRPAPTQEGADAAGERVSEPVKLRRTFKSKLQLVAEDARVEMGILIEQQMADYISREYLRVLKKKLAEAEG